MLDHDHTGFITFEDLKQALQESGADIDEEKIGKIIEETDELKTGKINYSEFLAATIDIKNFMTEEKLWMIFKRFDVDDRDFITKENLIEAMKKLGREVTEDEVDHIIE